MLRAICCCLLAAALTSVSAAEPIVVDACAVNGAIDGENIAFALDFAVTVDRAGSELDLAVGDLALLDHQPLPAGCSLRFDRARQALVARFDRRGAQALQLRVALRPSVDGEWREVRFDVPSSLVRELRLAADREDLEVDFPDALRQRREVVDGTLVATALQGPGEAFAVRWKPQVAELDAELVFAARSSVVAAVEPGALTVDQLIDYELAQGELDVLHLRVPDGVQITAVRGEHIRDWSLAKVVDGRRLVVTLNRPQRGSYALLVSAQRGLGAFPATASVPAIEPEGAMRHSGQLLLGTDSAVRLVVGAVSGCTQIDAAAVDASALRAYGAPAPPALKRFAYQFAAGGFAVELALDAIVPAIDVQHRLRLVVREDDVVLVGELDLEVRDAPIPALELALPEGFVLAEATGEALERDAAVTVERDGRRFASIPFAEPFQGRTLIALRLERGASLLGGHLDLRAPGVVGARVERGHLVLDAEAAVVLDPPAVEGLRQVHTASVPVAGGGRFAYRFRDAAWSLQLAARRRPAGVRAELFHLHAVDDGVVHGTVVVNYVITGAPVDVLRFRLPGELDGVEFVGADVVRSEREGDIWTIGLRRRVSGDYNLAIAFTQALGEDGVVQIGGIASLDAESESGFAVIAAQRDLRLELPEQVPGLLPIEGADLPPHYRLLVPAPLLASWSFAAAPPLLTLRVEDRASSAPLAALVELAEADTELSVTADDRVESRTVVRYQIKNAAAQFLPLRLPAGAGAPRAWIVGTGGERSVATVSRGEGDLLLVQLPRLADPNQPISLELSYGAAHGAVDEPLTLHAPELDLATTFTRWRVAGGEDWALLPQGGIQVQRDGSAGIGAGGALVAIGHAWWRALRSLPWPAILVIGCALTAAVAAFRRGLTLRVGLACIGLCLAVAGGLAVGSGILDSALSQRGDRSSLVLTQALLLQGGAAPRLDLDLSPSWLVGIDLPLVVVGLLLVAAACLRRWRALRPALGLGGAIALALSLPVLWPLAAHLATWFAVLVVAAVVAWRLRGGAAAAPRTSRIARGGVATALLLVVGLVLGGCGGSARQAPEDEGLRSVSADLVAEDDAMAVHLVIAGTIEPGDYRWLPPGAVLDDEQVLPERCAVVIGEDGSQLLRVERAVAAIELRFLVPLAAAGDDGRRSFGLALPEALHSRATLRVPAAGQRIVAPGAIQLHDGEDAQASWAESVLASGASASFAWWPRARAVEREETQAYAELHSVYRADRGVVAGRHRIDFRIAQGELRELVLRLAGGQTVTGVTGPGVGAWRFDPDGRLLVRLAKPARDGYRLIVSTQAPVGSLPGTVRLSPPVVEGVLSQRGIAGVAASRTVRVEVLEHPPEAGVDDVLRDGEALLAALQIEPLRLRHAFRIQPAAGELALRIHAVEPELRASEQATVRIGEERLGYSGQLLVDVTKAGVFALELAVPGEVDVDLLTAPQVSHWDERRDDDGQRLITVHLRADTTGRIPLQVALSRPIGEDDGRLTVPAVRLVGARKQAGQVVVVPERGLQLRVAERAALSEVNPREVGVDAEGALAFRVLGGDWDLQLEVERTRSLVRVEALHLARVAAAAVRHELRLRYALEHAGAKRLLLELPPGAFGLAVEGPEIARWDRRGDTVEVELARKWFDRTYPLTLRFETRIGDDGAVAIAPVATPGATIRRDHLAVFATDRVGLAVTTADDALLPADARAVPSEFGAGDLAAAAFCYRSAGRSYRLELAATRHQPAALQQAEVRSARVASVLTPRGDQLSQLRLELTVGARRHLRMALPAGSELWELSVNGRAVDAARDDAGAWLVPVAHTAVGELGMELLATWITPGEALAGRQELTGPMLDLPLRDVEWTVVVPEGWQADDFGGTLHHAPEAMTQVEYDLGTYLSNVSAVKERSLDKATAQIEAGDELAAKGEQYAARQALADAFNYSSGDSALNEDARIQLISLSQEQALACLLGRRGSLRQGQAAAPDLGDRFNRADVRRLAAGLTKDDSDNLARITARIAELTATVGAPPRITIGLPEQGRVLRFTAPLQVDPSIPMRVAFDAEREPDAETRSALPPLAALLALLIAATALPLWLGRLLPAGRERVAPAAGDDEDEAPVQLATDDAAVLLDELEAAAMADGETEVEDAISDEAAADDDTAARQDARAPGRQGGGADSGSDASSADGAAEGEEGERDDPEQP